MELDDLLDAFGGDRVRRVMSVVDLVEEHQDALLDAIGFIADHGDDLLDLIGRLPDILDRAGDALRTAAGAAAEASGFLMAGDGLDADDLTGAAGRAIEASRAHIDRVAALLDRVGDELADIAVPTLSVERSELMGLSVVSGLDVDRRPVATGATAGIRAGARQLEEVGEALAVAGEGLRRLQVNLEGAGRRIESVAGDVDRSGLALVELGSPDASTRRPPRPSTRKPTAKKRAATKKAASRKRTAKKAATRKKATTRRTPASKKAATKTAPTRKRPGDSPTLGGGVLRRDD